MREALDDISGENEGEDTEQHGDTDEQVSEEEDNVEHHPEHTHLMSLMRRSPVLKLLPLKDASPKMVRCVGAQYLMMYMMAG